MIFFHNSYTYTKKKKSRKSTHFQTKPPHDITPFILHKKLNPLVEDEKEENFTCLITFPTCAEKETNACGA